MGGVDCRSVEAVVTAGVACYDDPAGRVLGVLGYVQDVFGYLPEYALDLIAEQLDVPRTRLDAVCAFFRGFTTTPQGRHVLVVCDGTACHMKQAPEMLQLLEQLLGISAGQTTPDGEFTLKTTHCVGSCASAPILTIDGVDHARVRLSDVVQLIKRIDND